MNPRAVIIATGPSLTQADVDLTRRMGRAVYAVNDAYKLCPWADLVYACDEQWWGIHHEATGRFAPWSRWTTNDEAARKFGLVHIPGQHALTARRYFNTEGNWIVYGGNSGFQALNVAYLHGVRDAVLIGFDMGRDADEPGHFFGDHPSSIATPSPYRDWVEHFNRAAPEIAAAGMTVVNASRKTRLECFPRASLESLI